MSDGRGVLIVDDQPEIRRILELGLRGEGFDILTAATAEDGLDLICSQSPAVLILDLMMPLRDGWSFLRELEALGVARPAIIILSARSGEAERLVARGLGVEAYITKPFDIDDVARAVRRHVSPSRPGAGHRAS
jgi:two-component system, OmpR family, KDP operon response regulator KdpE